MQTRNTEKQGRNTSGLLEDASFSRLYDAVLKIIDHHHDSRHTVVIVVSVVIAYMHIRLTCKNYNIDIT